MVPPDSHRLSRARCYLGYNSEDSTFSGTGLSPSPATPSRGLPLTHALSHSPPGRQTWPSRPTTPNTQPLPGITCVRFSLLRFRSPLLTESLLFSLPVGTEMFHFPTFPPTALCVQAEVAGHYSGFFRGFPIRRSPDRCSFTSSPGLIAGYNVLRRLLVPRHPPTALSSLLLLQRCSRPL